MVQIRVLVRNHQEWSGLILFGSWLLVSWFLYEHLTKHGTLTFQNNYLINIAISFSKYKSWILSICVRNIKSLCCLHYWIMSMSHRQAVRQEIFMCHYYLKAQCPEARYLNCCCWEFQQLFDSFVLSMFVKLSQQSIISVTIVWSSQYSMNRGKLTTASQDNFSFDPLKCTFLFVLCLHSLHLPVKCKPNLLYLHWLVWL